MMYYCTLCAWLRKDTPCQWHGKAPSGQWHHLCHACMMQYGHKYSDVHKTGQARRSDGVVIFQ